jgi:hypothetical protein
MKLVLQEAKRHQPIVIIFQVVLGLSFFEITTLIKPLVSKSPKQRFHVNAISYIPKGTFAMGLLQKIN